MSIRTAQMIATLLVVLASAGVSAQSVAGLQRVRTIVIDPGHGGTDGGAVGVAEVNEKDLTLKVSRRFARALEQAFPDVQVVLTRDGDTYPTLEERSALANGVGADLFISIHFNAAMNPLAHGIETFWLDDDGTAPGEVVPGREDDGPALPRTTFGVGGDGVALLVDDLVRDGAMRESAQFAELMHRSLLRETGALDRGVRQGQFRVLRGVRAPAVVVELGFLSHEHEGERLIGSDYQGELVTGLVEAVADWDTWSYEVAADLVLDDDTRYASEREGAAGLFTVAMD